MFSQRELEVISESLNSMRLELVRIYSASKEAGMSIVRIKNELDEVENLKDKITKVLQNSNKTFWNDAG